MGNKTGWGAVGYGMGGGFEKDREKQRRALQAKEANTQSIISERDASTEALELQNQILQKEQSMMKNMMIAKDLTAGVDDFVTTGNTEVFNQLVKSNAYLAAKLNKNYGISSIDNFDFVNNSTHRQLAKVSLGLSDEAMSSLEALEPELLEDFNKGFVIARGKDGDYLSSIESFVESTGYLNTASTIQANNLQEVLRKVKNVGKVMTSNQQKDKMAIAYFEDPENKGKTWKDFEQEKLGEAPTLSEQKSSEVLKLMKEKDLSYKQALEMTTMDSERAGGRITTASLKSEYADLRVEESKGSLTKDSEIRLQVLDELFKTDNDEKREILKTGMEITSKYKGILFEEGTNITDEDILASKLYAQQAGIKPNAKANRDFKEEFNTVKHGRRLVADVIALKDEELSRGIVDTGIKAMTKLLNDKGFKSLSAEDQAKQLKTIEMDTKLGMFLAKYIKSISGTAVADAEFARLTNLFSGSQFNNVQTLRQGVVTFVQELDQNFKDSAQTNLIDNPSTTLDLVKRYRELDPMGEIPVEEPTIKPTVEEPTTQEVKTYESQQTKFSSLIGQTDPNTGKKLIGISNVAPFGPIYEGDE